MSFMMLNKKENPMINLNECSFLSDANLSWRAKGLLTYLLSLSNTANWTFEDLIGKSTEGKDAARTAFKELKEKGYIKAIEQRGENGRMKGIKYIIVPSVLTS